ncbi:MAG: glucoamylase family protein [Bryobacteraceae bacterium]
MKTRQAPLSDDALHKLQSAAIGYFLNETNPANGLVPDNTRTGAPASIASVGLGLTTYPIGVERRFLPRDDAIKRTLTALRWFSSSPQGEGPDATGYKGFYYHFLDMQTGRRSGDSEVSTIDTAYLLAGALTCALYFDRDTPDEREIRAQADALYRRADWQWALNGGLTVSMGWKPESGFLASRWEGYSEALILYVLGLGSPTFPLPADSYTAWTRTYCWKTLYDFSFLYAGPLFIHQLSHLWIDFRGIQDEYMRKRGIDYFENSRRATYIQREYAFRNPGQYKGYNENCWGITASEGPGPAVRKIDGVERHFHGYMARKIPDGPDDGTISPWAAAASLPFAPEIVLPSLQYIAVTYPEMSSNYGLKCSFNPTFSVGGANKSGWICDDTYALAEGPVVLMIENYLSGFLWRLTRKCPYFIEGLRRAGFNKGWL